MMLLRGIVFRGYCNGRFGRDGHGDKRVEDFGADWIIVRGTDGRPNAAFFDNYDDMMKQVVRWLDEDEEY